MNFTKLELLEYFRENSEETYRQAYSMSGNNQDKTKKMGQKMDELKAEIIQQIEQRYTDRYEKLEKIFIATYSWIVVSLERRNALWPYNSMDLSRRSGELWELLVKVAWEYPVNRDVLVFEAPSFADVMERIKESFKNRLATMNLSDEEKEILYNEYIHVWDILGESINLDSDQLFETVDEKYIVDFKGSYGSNEKGNKDRLLSVARIYSLLNYYNLTDKPYKCVLAVRTIQGTGHNYLRQLENSGLWEVRRGNEVYDMVQEFTGFDILSCIRNNNLNFERDFDQNTINYMTSHSTSRQRQTFLDYYLTWW
jgi:hypothetical protein